MSVTFKSHLLAHERGLARAMLERRFPQAGASSTQVPSTTSAAAQPTQTLVFTKPPHSVKALTGVIVVLGVVVLAIIGWKSWKWYNRRRPRSTWFVDEKTRVRESLFNFSNSDIGTEPQRVVLAPTAPSAESGARWVPQVKPFAIGPDPVTPPAPAKTKEYTRAGEKGVVSPPIYKTGEQTPSQPHGRPRQPPPPPPTGPLPSPPHSIGNSLKSLRLQFVPTFGTADAPVVSPPRSSSFAHQQSTPPAEPRASMSTIASSFTGRRKKVPRDMIVVQSFVPSMDDELRIVPGETLRLIEEFADGWCLCQRFVDGPNAEVVKGVIPRFCLDELRSSNRKSKSVCSIISRR